MPPNTQADYHRSILRMAVRFGFTPADIVEPNGLLAVMADLVATADEPNPDRRRFRGPAERTP